MNKPNAFEGPTCYVHWQCYARDKSEEPLAQEFILYSDAYLTGTLEDKFEPFHIVNCVSTQPRYGHIQPVIIFRMRYFDDQQFHQLPTNLFAWDRSRIKYHFPGGIKDEISSLLSLALGVRLKAGSNSRWFRTGNRYGNQHFTGKNDIPIFEFQPSEYPRLPWVTGPMSINSAEPLLDSFFRLSPELAYAVLRASRLYQEALWMAESQPELSWLLLVSAVEVAAGHQTQDCVELLRSEKPEWYDALCHSQTVLKEIANHWANLSGARKKFSRFLLENKPNPPSRRPHASAQIEWRDDCLGKMLRKVYDQRSRTLHSGIPFSRYMCVPAFQHQDWDAPSETSETNITLHIFEYLVRHSLADWWAASVGK